MNKIKILITSFLLGGFTYGQGPIGTPPPNLSSPQLGQYAWYRGGNNNGGAAANNNIFGTMWNSPIHIYTGGTHKAFFSNNFGLNSGIFPGGTGDGLRIMPGVGSGGGGDLSLFTRGSDETYVRWDGSGMIAGRANRFEQYAARAGFYFNTTTGFGVYKFARGGLVTGFVGTNNFWRIGIQADAANQNATRRLEVFDQAPQLRLTANPIAATFTDFFARPSGNLNILPSAGRVGININAEPTHTLDVNGDVRIRNIPIGIANCILIGTNQTGLADNQVSRLDFTGNANEVLLGNGTFGPLPNTLSANNGVSINASNAIQLGVPCNIGGVFNGAGIIGNSFTEDRVVPNRNFDLWFASNTTETGGVGFGGQPNGLPFCGTGNTVEISANNKNPQYGNTNASGLRFTSLTALSPALPNGTNGLDNTKVLTVDGDGDVVLTELISGLGGVCGNAPLQTNNWEISLDNHTFIFSGQQSNDRVGIGTGCLPTAKLQVLDNSGTVGQINTSINTTHSNGLSAALVVTNSSTVVGSIGGLFQASSANKTHAIVVPNNGGNVGFGTTTPNTTYRLEVVGQSNFIGNVFSSGILQFSDQIFKTNISSFTNAMSIIDQLNPTSYYLDTLNNYGMLFSNQKQYGFIAQEVEQILPELVTESTKAATYDSAGVQLTQGVNYKSLNYQAIIPILTQGIKEQQHVINTQDSVITDLNNRLTTLENCLSGILPFLCQLSNSSIQQNDEQTQQNIIKELKVQLDNSQSIVLGQNVPNPFAEQTVIEYYIPEAVKQAQIIFYNQTGQIINTVNIEEMGNGRLTVFANDLSIGIYTYTLVADGQIIATKKMIKK